MVSWQYARCNSETGCKECKILHRGKKIENLLSLLCGSFTSIEEVKLGGCQEKDEKDH